jgi:predicted amidohydrolase
MRIAFLHLSPVPGALSANRDRIWRGIEAAADKGARWILTPELATCGYTFAKDYGLDWIAPVPDPWCAEIGEIAARHGTTVFLATPERDRDTGNLYNSLLVFDGVRGFVGSHRKVKPLRVGSEAWSSPGTVATVLPIDGFGPVGLLICADACAIALAEEMKRRGARALVSGANWSPGMHGPSGEWEAITACTGLPLFVCNRTGEDGTMSFASAETVVAADGRRHLSFASPDPSLVLADWDFAEGRLLSWNAEVLGGGPS